MSTPSLLKDYFIPLEVFIEPRWVNELHGVGRTFSVLRLDKIHPIVGGNKAFKLYYNIRHFFEGSYEGIVSVGGKFSNHIAALAQVGKDFAIPTVGFIRGESSSTPTFTIQRAIENGMEINYVSREEYREIRKKDYPLIDFPKCKNYLFIPEGGSNDLGVEGGKHITSFIPADITHILCAVGTGATLKGIVKHLNSHQKIIGIKVLEAQQEGFIFQNLDTISQQKIILNSEFTFGGYAKKNEVLDDFVQKWNENDSIKIEPIYTGRLFYAAHEMLKENFFPESAKVLIIHTGGLQYLIH